MTETKASAGARELARDIADLLAVPVVDANKLGLARLIDEFLKPFVHAAHTILERVDNDLLPKGDFPGVPSAVARLRNALAPWEPGQ